MRSNPFCLSSALRCLVGASVHEESPGHVMVTYPKGSIWLYSACMGLKLKGSQKGPFRLPIWNQSPKTMPYMVFATMAYLDSVGVPYHNFGVYGYPIKLGGASEFVEQTTGQVAPTRLWLDTTTDELYLRFGQ